MNQQKLSFQAGQRNALEKLYQFILMQEEEGSRVTTADIINYVQTEIDYQGEEPSMSPRPPTLNQNPQQMHFMNPGFLVTSGSSGVLSAGHMLRSDPSEQQPRNHVFSNALSSPVRHSLQNYHISQGGYLSNNVQPSNVVRNNEGNFISNQDRFYSCQLHQRFNHGYAWRQSKSRIYLLKVSRLLDNLDVMGKYEYIWLLTLKVNQTPYAIGRLALQVVS